MGEYGLVRIGVCLGSVTESVTHSTISCVQIVYNYSLRVIDEFYEQKGIKL